MSILLLISLVLACGVFLVGSAVYERRTIDFTERIAPQMKATEIQFSLLNENVHRDVGLLEGLLELLRPFVNNLALTVNSSTVNTEALQRRLIRAGQGMTVTQFRAEQLLWSIIALMGTAVVLGLGLLQGKVSVFGALLLCILATVGGFLARDWWLGEAIKKRESRMLAEFPAIAELMALSVTAGESAVGAIERVCRSSSGELVGEFQRILVQMRTGDGLISSLQDFSQRTEVAPLARFVDGIVVAIERGTPLSDVLRAQAQDARDSSKRDLMEAAGKKEIAMMAPIIFCILPLTVVFALFPGLSLLNFKL